MKADEWLDIAALWAGLWPNQPLPPESIEPWYALLADLPGVEVEAALRAFALGDRGWPPRSAGELRAAAEPPPRPWEDALADLRALVGRHGSYATLNGAERPHADDAALDAVIGSYGWQTVCSLEVGNATVRAQFRDAYQAAQTRLRDEGRRAHARAVTTGTTMQALTGGA